MSLLLYIALTASAVADDDPTYRYITCIKVEAARLANASEADEAVAEMAVMNCEEFASASAQAFVDETPADILEAYREAGVTPEMYLERQKQIGRNAGKAMAIDILSELHRDNSAS